MIRRYMAPLKAALMLSDGLSAVALFLVLLSVRFVVLDGSWAQAGVRPIELALSYGLLWVGTLWFVGFYRLRTHWTMRSEAMGVLRATAFIAAVSLGALYLFDLVNVSRLFLGMLFLSQPLVTVVLRTGLRRVLDRLRRSGRIRREILIVGTGPEAEAFANVVEQNRELGLHVLGHLHGPREAEPAVTRQVIGGLDDLENVLHASAVDEVALCLSPQDWSYVEPVTRICEEEGKIVRVSIKALGGLLSGGTFEEVGGLPIVTFLYGPDRFVSLALKRLLDILVSGAGLVLLSPVLAALAAYVALIDGRPVLFHQQRVGLHGRIFNCVKFRTMVRDAEQLFPQIAEMSDIRGAAFKMADDPRAIPAARWLRRTGLDELPQLWNVLRGEMSVVGPRPAPAREVDKYSVWHRRRLSMRPGLTGLWQVSNQRYSDFDERVSVDLDYIDSWTLWMDIKILLRTIPAVIMQNGR
jgi:exopolysaccharide biosynthesis polyprenyl glycosylphosphotransferase